MNNTLKVNPFLELLGSTDLDNGFELIAPKPHRGLQRLQIFKTEYPNLHEVFFDLSQTKFDFLDLQLDVDEKERELLYEYGILVDSDNVPQKALFNCQLDELEPNYFDIDFSALIVNPSFRFEPFDFNKFVSLVHLQHLSPHQATVWIRQPFTDLEMGYWLGSEQAQIISKLVAGEKISFEIEPQLLAKLVTAEILTTSKLLLESEEQKREALAVAQLKYQEDKYVVLRELLPDAQMKAMRRYYREYLQSGFMPFDDSQSKRFYQHNEPLSRVFHRNLTKLMSLVIGEEVIPSYVYSASYIDCADLKPHTDREQCEFSISFQIDYLPEQENHLSPWGLFVYAPENSKGENMNYLYDYFPASSEIEDNNPRVYLASGDGLIYKGRELVHYRYPLTPGAQSTSLFFHYVAKDFTGRLS